MRFPSGLLSLAWAHNLPPLVEIQALVCNENPLGVCLKSVLVFLQARFMSTVPKADVLVFTHSRRDVNRSAAGRKDATKSRCAWMYSLRSTLPSTLGFRCIALTRFPCSRCPTAFCTGHRVLFVRTPGLVWLDQFGRPAFDRPVQLNRLRGLGGLFCVTSHQHLSPDDFVRTKACFRIKGRSGYLFPA